MAKKLIYWRDPTLDNVIGSYSNESINWLDGKYFISAPSTFSYNRFPEISIKRRIDEFLSEGLRKIESISDRNDWDMALPGIHAKFNMFIGRSFQEIRHVMSFGKEDIDLREGKVPRDITSREYNSLPVNLKIKRNCFESLSWLRLTEGIFKLAECQIGLIPFEGVKLDAGAGYSRRFNDGYALDINRVTDDEEDRIVYDYENNSEKIPLPDGSIDRIYACHLLEHLSDKGLENFLRESYRLLKMGGIINVIVPHSSSPSAEHPWHKTFWNEWFLKEICGKVKVYTPIEYGFSFKLIYRIVVGKRSDDLHFNFILEKISAEEERRYIEKGDACFDFDESLRGESIRDYIGYFDYKPFLSF